MSISTQVTWLSVSPVDGHIIAELHSAQCSEIEVRMMEATTVSLDIPWDNIPRNWEQATTPFAACLLLIAEDNPHRPLFGGIILNRTRSVGANTISLKIGTWEHLLNKYTVGDDSYTNTDQNQIIAHLVTKWAITNKRNSLTIEATASARRRDDTNHSQSDNKSVLSCIQELSCLADGSEWYIDWQYVHDGYRPVLHVADHIGTLQPRFTFMADRLSEFVVEEQWEEGYGANTVQAYSSSTSSDSNAVQPQSQWHTHDDPLRPVLPYRYQPSTSITRIDTLDDHARAKLQALADGTNTISVSFALATMPRLGRDWDLGDAVAWDLSELSAQLTDFARGITRFIGYKINLQNSTFTPFLQNNGEV